MKTIQAICIGLCMAAGLAWAADVFKPFKYRENVVEGVPKEWGRLVNASSFSDGSSVLYFEATGGTIRRVAVKFYGTDAQYASHVMTIPRP